ncbi:HAD family hydrolase [Salinisphaera hydrothermalis]|uniref:HAD family hydrolase n=1 Tax=Salinisphaera hydrothermalis TaxID=563188 RepID=UPI0033415FB2
MAEQYAVLWDLDGTLVDSEPLHHEAIVELLSQQGIKAPSGFQQAVTGLSAFDTWRHCRDQLGFSGSFEGWVEAKYRHYLREAPNLIGFEASTSAYRHYQALGWAQAIVSNSDRLIVQANLAAAELQSPEQITVTRNDVRHGKPAPEGYLRAAWLLGVDPSRCVVIEDSIAGARAGIEAGMRVIGLIHDPSQPPAFPKEISKTVAFETLDERGLVAEIETLFEIHENREREQAT